MHEKNKAFGTPFFADIRELVGLLSRVFVCIGMNVEFSDDKYEEKINGIIE